MLRPFLCSIYTRNSIHISPMYLQIYSHAFVLHSFESGWCLKFTVLIKCSVFVVVTYVIIDMEMDVILTYFHWMDATCWHHSSFVLQLLISLKLCNYLKSRNKYKNSVTVCYLRYFFSPFSLVRRGLVFYLDSIRYIFSPFSLVSGERLPNS